MTSNVFPITVVAAIILFLLKEILETYRKVMAKRRKVEAIKVLLASEIEKNCWVVRSLRLHLQGVPEDWATSDYQIIDGSPTRMRIKHVRADGGGGSFGVFPTSSTVFENVIFDLAALDEKLFSLSTKAYGGVANIAHVSESFIEYVRNKGDPDSDVHLNGFCNYAFRELSDAYISLAALYQACTARDLDTHRVRSYI